LLKHYATTAVDLSSGTRFSRDFRAVSATFEKKLRKKSASFPGDFRLFAVSWKKNFGCRNLLAHTLQLLSRVNNEHEAHLGQKTIAADQMDLLKSRRLSHV
jgi:hypothetical protein